MKVFLATPCYHAEVSLNYMVSLLYETPAIIAAGHGVQFKFSAGDAVNRQRNHLAAEFLKTDCTHLLFVDSDTGFRGEDVVRMLSFNRPVVAVNYPKREYFWEQARGNTVRELRDSLLGCSVGLFRDDPAPGGALFPIEYAGTGLMLIQREVLQAMIDQKIVEQLNGDHLYRFFQFRVLKGQDLGEDYSFCDFVRQAGFEVWLDSQAEASHMGWHLFEGRPALGEGREREDGSQKSGEMGSGQFSNTSAVAGAAAENTNNTAAP